jgi:hypothetical protein
MASWSDTDKQSVFIVILDEIRAMHGQAALIPLDAGNSVDRGYLLSAEGMKGMKGYFDLYGPKLTEEDEARFAATINDPSLPISAEARLESLKQVERQSLQRCLSAPITS